ncbi:acyl carrier protein [Streptomyces cocklensis]|jgi:acyl carrier protein|uniref:Polyketide-8 synthase acyl carrier protein 1 n=1 Tax=Actinacidiphila cocklensis TaxID=887465 RepID=A0A9W4DGS6_9ACTN|nr:acyl carrier protein [Actinacidiphila cocklensis]MDD1063720.1 acyl carrier protein [Actinacidiphila cocklensis]WSX72915.1 acyl carrier protein [Streptomyces sp. NBC_00899]WSX81017.1 acyl carrier protein [Streptomyces sp. NBC_00899]CAG6391064.1 Polyketide-8 synthase acyl carrier protein 1 [Actinacidiphila cocklensis]
MAVISADTRDRIKTLVSDVLEVESDELTDTSRFVEDHDADSMRLIEILSSLELNLKVTIPQSELPRMVNLSGVYDVVGEIRP